MDINYEQYIEQQQKIIEKFSSTTFFDTFNEYLNVDKISDNEIYNSWVISVFATPIGMRLVFSRMMQ